MGPKPVKFRAEVVSQFKVTENFYKQKFQIGIKYLFLYLQQKAASINYLGIETDKRVATPITFVY